MTTATATQAPSVKLQSGATARKGKISAAHALWWGLFATGGMVAAVLLPVHILLQGILGPMGVLPVVSNRYDTAAAAVANPLVKLYLFVLISLPFFHAAHRLRFLVFELGLRGGRMLVPILCYGAAILGMLAAALVLLTVP